MSRFVLVDLLSQSNENDMNFIYFGGKVQNDKFDRQTVWTHGN